MGQSTNSKVKLVYFNLEDEEELMLFNKANSIKNFSRWVKKQLRGNNNQTEKEEKMRDDKIDVVENKYIDSMML